MAGEREVPGWTRSAEHAPKVLGVAELNRLARFELEDRFPDVWVEGELADVRTPGSGHVYFTLTDPGTPAQVKGVMYRNDAQRARARMENGVRVRLRCGLTIYEARGEYQLTARVALPAGEGDRAAEVARVRKKLAEEGLLDPARKRRLPRLPRTIALVTSRDGAALHDFVRVARGRMPIRIVLVHCQVQGEGAPRSIVRALRGAHRVPGVELIVVARGGGASEDLSAFDDEEVARAISKCRYPTVSGIGHEIDVTLVDLVADVRAATPSNAAEIAVPDRALLAGELEARERALSRALDQRIQRDRLVLERLVRRLGDPRRRVAAPRQGLAVLSSAMQRSVARRIADARRTLERLRARLQASEPRARLVRDRERLRALEERMQRAVRERLASERRGLVATGRELEVLASGIAREPRAELERAGAKLEALASGIVREPRAELERAGARLEALAQGIVRGPRADLERATARLGVAGPAIVRGRRAELGTVIAKLDVLSPLGILARGYAIALHEGKALVRATDARAGDVVEVRLHEGSIVARVERTEG